MTGEPRYVVARRPNGGLGLAQVIDVKDGIATIKRLMGQKFRKTTTIRTVPRAKKIPAADIIRDATPRELVLGHPV